MFTGIVERTGRVVRVEPGASATLLVIDTGEWLPPVALGESISISGCCLTVSQVWVAQASRLCSASELAFDAIPQTLTLTTLGRLAAGSRVNLERSATPNTFLGGHVVQGHVDGVGTVELVSKGDDWRIRVRPPTTLMPYLVPQGSICINGVSLTLASVDVAGGWFEVALIPTTLRLTTLAELGEGTLCNLEADAMAKTVVHYLRHFAR